MLNLHRGKPSEVKTNWNCVDTPQLNSSFEEAMMLCKLIYYCTNIELCAYRKQFKIFKTWHD